MENNMLNGKAIIPPKIQIFRIFISKHNEKNVEKVQRFFCSLNEI